MRFQIGVTEFAAVSKKFVMLSIGLFFLSEIFVGCSSTPSSEIAKIPLDADPAEQIAQFAEAIKQGEANLLDWLAPTHFKIAEKRLASAKAIFDSHGKNSEVFRNLEEGQAFLQDSQRYAKVSQTTLPTAIKAREDATRTRLEAEKAGAKDLNATYQNADLYFLKLSRAIENNDLKWAESQQDESVRLYRQAAADANKKQFLDNAKSTVELAKKEGAQKYAPSALQIAQNSIAATEKFSDNNPFAKDQTAKLGEEAMTFATHLLNLTRESSQLDAMSPEKRAEWVQKSLNRVGKGLNLSVQAQDSFETQISSIEKSLQNISKHTRSLEGAALEAKNLASENKELRTERKLTTAWNQKFEEVRDRFERSEAEVLRDGDHLIIRLKDIHFGVGKSQIPSRDFALLNKVQKAIAEFDNSKVVVEGHTDSTGSAAFNWTLSEKRAHAVREYLVANESISPDEIRAEGKGFSRPLSDNKTAAGRAMNRRVDIVIEPARGTATENQDSSEPVTSE